MPGGRSGPSWVGSAAGGKSNRTSGWECAPPGLGVPAGLGFPAAGLSNEALEGRLPISETRRLRLREALAPDPSALLGLAPETPVQRAPKVRARGRQPREAERGRRSHSRRRRGEGRAGDAAGPGLSLRAMGGPGPSSPGNLSGQRRRFPWRQSRTQEAEAFLAEKGALLPCPSGRRESRPALGILTAQPPNKTRAQQPPPAGPGASGKTRRVPRRWPGASRAPPPRAGTRQDPGPSPLS